MRIINSIHYTPCNANEGGANALKPRDEHGRWDARILIGQENFVQVYHRDGHTPIGRNNLCDLHGARFGFIFSEKHDIEL